MRPLSVLLALCALACTAKDGGGDTDTVDVTDEPSDDDTTDDEDPECGNGEEEGDEDCDDGNDVDGDGCNNDCTESGAVRWQTYVDGASRDDCANDLAVDSDGMVGFAGEAIADAEGTANIFAGLLDADGEVLWTVTHDSESDAEDSGGSTDRGYGVALTDDGGLIVAGHELLVNEHVWVARYDDDTGPTWTRTGPDTLDGRGYDAAVGPDGEVYVVGTHGITAFVTKYNDNGLQFWDDDRSLDNPCNGCDAFTRAVAMPDGGALVAGRLRPENGEDDAMIVRYDADGDELWADQLNVGDDGVIDASPAGEQVLVTYRFDDDVQLRMYDADGDTAWTLSDPMPEGFLVSVAATPDGGFVAIAAVTDEADVYTLVRRFDADGEALWEREVRPTEAAYQSARRVAVSEAGVFIAGCDAEFVPGDSDAWIVALTP